MNDDMRLPDVKANDLPEDGQPEKISYARHPIDELLATRVKASLPEVVDNTEPYDDYESLPDLYKNPEETKKSRLRTFRDYALVLVIAIFVAVAIRYLVFDMYEVPTGSMSPTIEIGDHVLAEKITLHFSSVSKGDIVFFDDPEEEGRILVKRVIAISGQTVTLRDGMVFIEGQGLFEPYTHGESTYPLDVVDQTLNVDFPYTVPEGYIWVLGDNRENSLDSRIFGAVPDNAILARALFIIWPFERFGFLD